MALLWQESGRQKAGNGWESRKGSGEACGGEQQRKAVCVTRGDRGGEDKGATHRHLLYISVSFIQEKKKTVYCRRLKNP